MGQFSVTIYGATGSVLSDIQHPTLDLMARTMSTDSCGTTQ